MNSFVFLTGFFDRNTLLSLEIYIIFILFLTYAFVSAIRKLSKSVINRRFICFMAAVLASIIFDLLCYFCDEKGGVSTRILNIISNSCYVSLSMVLCYFWFFFSVSNLDFKWATNKKIMVIARIIVGIHIIMAITSNWTGFMFYIDENGVYQRGKLFFLQLLPWVFSFLATALSFYRLFDKNYVGYRKFALSLILFSLFPLVCEIFQLTGAGSPSISIGYALGTLFMYIILLEDNISSDGLTGLNNRSHLIKYLVEKIKHVKKSDETYLFIMDINDFKTINDTYGHVEGDKALIILSNCLRDIEKEYQGYTARYGGDEFVIIADNMSQEKAEILNNKINEVLLKASKDNNLEYELTLSIGYTKCYSSDINSIDKLIARADGLLYLNKNNYKEAKLNNQN